MMNGWPSEFIKHAAKPAIAASELRYEKTHSNIDEVEAPKAW